MRKKEVLVFGAGALGLARISLLNSRFSPREYGESTLLGEN
jgi:hypothetical protein